MSFEWPSEPSVPGPGSVTLALLRAASRMVPPLSVRATLFAYSRSGVLSPGCTV